MKRIAITARLKDGCETRARELVEAGPPFDPREAGLDHHGVFVGPELVVFVFEGDGVEQTVSRLLNDRLGSAAFSAWGPLLAEPPRMAHEAYHWNLKEDTMERIVIATDGSESAHEAIELGLELATEQGAEPIFVHVVPEIDVMPASGFGMAIPPAVPHEPTDDDRAPLEAALELAAEEGIDARTELLAGNPAAEIVAYADTVDADLIVVGSRGHGRIASALLGSVSRGVLSESKRPVLIVRGVHAAAEMAAGR